MKDTAHIFSHAWGFASDFASDEDGAITVDWIVLTALVVLMGLGAAFFVAANVPGLAENIGEYMSTRDITE